MNIVVLDGFTLNPGDNSWEHIESLGKLTVYDRTSPAEIIARAAPADILLTNKTPLTSETIAQLPNLKFISVLATGFNIVDIDAAGNRGIPVSNVPIYGTDTVAQHVFAMLLAFVHRPYSHDAAIRDGEWNRRIDFSFSLNPILELSGLVMGIVGYGKIGQRVAEIAHAFGMNVLAFNPSLKPKPDFTPFEFSELVDVFSQSDVVSLHCPLTQENNGMLNNELIGLMKPSAILINTSRGGLVNEPDLAEALCSGTIAGACLDVFSEEPINPDNPLLQARNCLMTPHNAWAATAARQRMMDFTGKNIEAFLLGRPINLVKNR